MHTLENGAIQNILSDATRAPSTHNTQPWLFRIIPRGVEVLIDHSRLLPEADPMRRDCYISHGCLIESITVAARSRGYAATCALLPDGDGGPTARVLFEHVLHNHEIRKWMDLQEALRFRYNARGVFTHRVLSSEELALLSDISTDEARVFCYTQSEVKNAIATIVAHAIPLFHARPAFRREFAGWMRPNTSSKQDGIYGFSVFAPNVISYLLPHVLRIWNMGQFLAARNQETLQTASLVAIVATKNDTRREWIHAGMLLQQLLLRAHTRGLAGSNFASPIEEHNARRSVMEFTEGWLPQLVVAIGQPKHPLPLSPRLPLETRILPTSAKDAVQ